MTIILRGDVAHSLVEDKSKEAILRGEPSILGEGRELHTSDHLDHHSSLRSQLPKVQHITLVGNCSKTNRGSVPSGTVAQ